MSVGGPNIGQKLCEAWGLDAGRVSKIDISVRPDEVVVAVAEFHPNEEEMELLTQYDLVKREKGDVDDS